jgi:hypothetical protein
MEILLCNNDQQGYFRSTVPKFRHHLAVFHSISQYKTDGWFMVTEKIDGDISMEMLQKLWICKDSIEKELQKKQAPETMQTEDRR